LIPATLKEYVSPLMRLDTVHWRAGELVDEGQASVIVVDVVTLTSFTV